MASSAGARTRSKVATAVKAFFDAAKSGNGVGVVGASSNRAKFGNKVLRAYIKHGYKAHPVNPSGGTIEGLDVVTDVSGLPKDVKCLSIITPPKFAADVVKGAIAHGIEHLWFQPGAEDADASKTAVGAKLHVIDDGTCVLVQLNVSDDE